MGHQHLGELPTTLRWQQVIDLLSAGADLRDVAAATSSAAEQQMVDAGNDTAVKYSFWLLTQILAAAQAPDFGRRLRDLGILVRDRPTLFEILGATVDAIDRQVLFAGGRTDLGEMAQLAMVESVSATVGRELNDLFRVSAEKTRSTFAEFLKERHFALLATDFFARLARRQLAYFLSRELSQHVGANSRFRSVEDHRRFEDALDRHCREASQIIRDFSGQWLSKHLFQKDLDETQAGAFVHIAFRKMREEIRVRRGTNVAA